MYRAIINPTQSDFTIHLPEEMIGHSVEIIAFPIDEINHSQDEEAEQKRKFEKAVAFWNSHPVDMSNFKFDRDEANER